MDDYKLSVDYEGLPEENLEEIVDWANSCQQTLSFSCRKAPLKLSSLTWFSSPKETMFSNFGATTDAVCPCSSKYCFYMSSDACLTLPSKRVWKVTFLFTFTS